MKKKFFLGLGTLIFISLVTFNYNISFSTKNGHFDLANSNLIALSQGESFMFDGTSWNNTDTHDWFSTWLPHMTTCKVTVGPPFYQEEYDGHAICCINGNGNCFNGTSCIPGA